MTIASSIIQSVGDIEIRLEPVRKRGYPIKLFDGSVLYAGYCLEELPRLRGEDLVEDGQRLFDWLLHDPKMREAWGEIKGRYSEQRAIRLWLDEEAPELHMLPWELLHDGDTALAADDETPFSRYLMTSHGLPRPALRPINVLVAIAAPVDLEEHGLSPIHADNEHYTITAAIKGQDARVTVLDGPCTLEALDHALTRDYHILHLIAHGDFDETTQQSSLILANEDNTSRFVSQEEFVGVLQRHMGSSAYLNDRSLRLIYLSSCRQAQRSSADSFAGIAARLVQIGVPAVLAMQDLIPDNTAYQFSRRFYRELLRNGRVDLACNRARSHIMAVSPFGDGSMPQEALRRSAIPILFMHRKDGWLWDRAGFVGGSRDEGEMNLIAADMQREKFTLVLGPDFHPALLGSRREIARRWASSFGFPLSPEKREDLPEVAQYLAVKRGPRFPREQLCEQLRRDLLRRYPDLTANPDDYTIDELICAAGEHLQDRNADDPYRIVAELPIRVYITTAPTSMLVNSLRAAGKKPYVSYIPWNDAAATLCDNATANGGPPNGLNAFSRPNRYQRPSTARPHVYYLFGHLQELDSVILPEDDYFDFLIKLTDQRELLPLPMRKAFSASALMFLGFGLEEFAFRVIFRAIVHSSGNHLSREHRHVAAQVNPQMSGLESVEDAKEYLGSYFDQEYVSVYWGSVTNFLAELHQRVVPDAGHQTEEPESDHPLHA